MSNDPPDVNKPSPDRGATSTLNCLVAAGPTRQSAARRFLFYLHETPEINFLLGLTPWSILRRGVSNDPPDVNKPSPDRGATSTLNCLVAAGPTRQSAARRFLFYLHETPEINFLLGLTPWIGLTPWMK